MATKPVLDLATFNPVCGQCMYWDAIEVPDEEVGECYLNPPLAHLDDEGSLMNLRPILENTERVCSFFKGKQ